jgi:pSer/pThr/pTyr-binding forkhead associated (FHA) protein
MSQDRSPSGIPAIGKIEIHAGDQVFVIDAPGAEGYIIGRSDKKSSYIPDIDLARCDALEKGVSRRHAALISHQNCLHLVDLESVNGTHINGQRLDANHPWPIAHGDQVRLGTLTLTFLQSQ